IQQVVGLWYGQTLRLVNTGTQIPVGEPGLQDGVSRIQVLICQAQVEISLRMLGTIDLRITFGAIEIQQMPVEVTIRLLVCSPIQVIQRIIIAFAYSLKK